MSKEEENRIFWGKFFIHKKDDIQKDVQLANNHRYPGQSGLYKKALFGLRRCNQERIAKEGKILSLEDITLNHIHFNFKYFNDTVLLTFLLASFLIIEHNFGTFLKEL